MAVAKTDTGAVRENNQDSALIKHASYRDGEVMLAAVCDGMGGLEKGELASATVVRELSRWFDEELPRELADGDIHIIANKLTLLIRALNVRLLDYGKESGESLGTTASVLLFLDQQYVIVHVGDSRIYRIGHTAEQLTQDQTFVAREVERGTLTAEQARTDRRRNILLQCVGASDVLEPQVVIGRTAAGTYMVCSDGLYHQNTPEELCALLHSDHLSDRETMKERGRQLIAQAMRRKEQDNITLIVIKAV